MTQEEINICIKEMKEFCRSYPSCEGCPQKSDAYCWNTAIIYYKLGLNAIEKYLMNRENF